MSEKRSKIEEKQNISVLDDDEPYGLGALIGITMILSALDYVSARD